MNPQPPARCPFQSDSQPSATVTAPMAPTPAPGQWPPGPSARFAGLDLMWQMSRDMLGAQAKWKRRYGDVVHLPVVHEHQIIVSDPELVRELLVTQHDALIRWERGIEVFAQLHGQSVLVTEGAVWKAKRQALQPAFTPKAVQAFLPTIAAAATHALDGWPESAERWPIESALTSLTMDVIMRMVFSAAMDGGGARNAEQAVHEASKAGDAEFYWPASWPDTMPWKRKKREALRFLRDLVQRHLSARQAMPQELWPDDLLTRLLALHVQDPATWTLQAVHDECVTAFLAGHETVAASLTWWTWCMATHPEAQQRAAREVQTQLGGRVTGADDVAALPFLTSTLQEAMRLYPAAPMLITRRAVRPVTLGPWRLPARTLFMVPIWLIQHDPRWVTEPETFRPKRFDNDGAHAPRAARLAFGLGPRVCLGQHLATTEMTTIAALLLQRFVLSTVAGQAPTKPVMRVTLRPEKPLHLALVRR